MAEAKTPDAWVGSRVDALIVTGYGDPMQARRTLTAWWETGTLDEVNDRGIVATFEDEDDDEPPETMFYPWTAVLRLRPSRMRT